jgi:hypothetical protein
MNSPSAAINSTSKHQGAPHTILLKDSHRMIWSRLKDHIVTSYTSRSLGVAGVRLNTKPASIRGGDHPPNDAWLLHTSVWEPNISKTTRVTGGTWDDPITSLYAGGPLITTPHTSYKDSLKEFYRDHSRLLHLQFSTWGKMCLCWMCTCFFPQQ